MSWSRSPGHVDWYDVSVKDDASSFGRRNRVLGTAALRSVFSSLAPGTRYNISVVAMAGNKRAAPVHATVATGEVKGQQYLLS